MLHNYESYNRKEIRIVQSRVCNRDRFVPVQHAVLSLYPFPVHRTSCALANSVHMGEMREIHGCGRNNLDLRSLYTSSQNRDLKTVFTAEGTIMPWSTGETLCYYFQMCCALQWNKNILTRNQLENYFDQSCSTSGEF